MGMLSDDPYLGGKRNELIAFAAQKLANARMITYDAQDGQFQITGVGRIAAKYYIRYKSIEIFNESLVPKMSEADVLAMISKSVEVKQSHYSYLTLLINRLSLNRSRFANPRLQSWKELWIVSLVKSR